MQLICYPEIKKESCLPIFVTGVGIDYVQKNAVRPILKYPHIIVTVSGCGLISVGTESHEMVAGSAVYISGGTDYECSPLTTNWVINWVTFDYGEGMSAFSRELFLARKVLYFERCTLSDPENIIRQIHESVSTDSTYGGFTASASMYRLLIILNREISAVPTKNKINPMISAVIEYIDEHYTEELTLEKLCAVGGGLSEQYLCRLFKQASGLRPVEYILKKRITAARTYLENSDMPISEVAEKTGFHNTSYFYRNFKKFTGTSPLACRQKAALVRNK